MRLAGTIHGGPSIVERRRGRYDQAVPTERILALAGLVLSLLLLSRFGPPAWRAWQILAGVRKRRLADAGPLAIPPPPAVAQRLEELGALGFSRIGERSSGCPGRPIRYEWDVGEESAEGVRGRGAAGDRARTIVGFYSSFDDSTWVQTNFPRGSVVDRPGFQASFVTTSLTEALAAHRAAVARLRPPTGHHGRSGRWRTCSEWTRTSAPTTAA